MTNLTLHLCLHLHHNYESTLTATGRFSKQETDSIPHSSGFLFAEFNIPFLEMSHEHTNQDLRQIGQNG